MKIRLIKEPDEKPFYNSDNCKIEMSFEEENLDEVLEKFTNFLRACGFVIDYDEHLEIINEGENYEM